MTEFKPYFINKLIVKYAKHIQKRKTKKREQLKNIELMKSLKETSRSLILWWIHAVRESMSRRPKIKDYQSTITWKSLSYLTWERGGLHSNACEERGGGGEEGLESIKLLTSFIQQMHEMKPRSVWPKSPNLKMFILIFSAVEMCCSF